MTEPARQLPLGIALRDDATLDNFLFYRDLMVVAEALQSSVSAGGERFIYLHGSEYSGRSHLLQGVCQLAEVGAALYLPLQDLLDIPPRELLDGVENRPLICLDNLDAIVGHQVWEQTLFHLCNRVLETSSRLVFSAGQAPRHLGVELPDLASRLAWGLVFQLPQADETEKLAILRFRADRRGLELSKEAASYIMSRAGRSMVALMNTLDELDRASLVHQRRVSIPFIKSTLKW